MNQVTNSVEWKTMNHPQIGYNNSVAINTIRKPPNRETLLVIIYHNSNQFTNFDEGAFYRIIDIKVLYFKFTNTFTFQSLIIFYLFKNI